jgi:hypothetical protein
MNALDMPGPWPNAEPLLWIHHAILVGRNDDFRSASMQKLPSSDALLLGKYSGEKASYGL